MIDALTGAKIRPEIKVMYDILVHQSIHQGPTNIKYTHTHTCTHTCAHIHIPTMFWCTRVYISVQTTSKNTNARTHIHPHTHTYTHAHDILVHQSLHQSPNKVK